MGGSSKGGSEKLRDANCDVETKTGQFAV